MSAPSWSSSPFSSPCSRGLALAMRGGKRSPNSGGTSMPIEHGAKVRTKDGHQAGHVKHAIWDPSGKKIIEYVIATGGLLGHDVVVSPELLEGASRDGSEIVLNITKRELDELAHYESGDYTAPPADWSAPAVFGF